MKDRTPRSTEVREEKARPASWKPPEQYPMPPPQPGVVFRWIRTSICGQPDTRNASKRFREGWEPVPAAEFPEFHLTSDTNSQYSENFEVGGLLLCRCSEEVMNERKRYYQKVTDAQIDSVDNSMFKMADPRVPMFRERKSRVIFGKRRPDSEDSSSSADEA